MTQCDKLPASAIFHCPFVNKGEAFTKEERAKYGLSGLLPTAVSTVDQHSSSTVSATKTKICSSSC